MTWFLIPFAIIAVILMAAYYTYRTAFYSPKRGRADPYAPVEGEQYLPFRDRIIAATRRMDSLPFEPIWISADDGTMLFGRYYHSADGAPLQILFHGYRSSALRDSSGGHGLARKLKFNILVIDERAHGISGGHTISFGIKERYDCLNWVQYANDRFGKNQPIILSGLSMGAATVLMASDLRLPANVCCIIADSPFSSPIEIIQKVCAEMHYPPKLSYPFILLGAKIFGGFNLLESSAVKSVSHTKIPILLIHGKADFFVPCSMSEEICNASVSRTELHLIPNAGHGLAYMTDPAKYEKITCDFLNTIPQIQSYFQKNEAI
ncbi:MAG: prolyl oligopeptidase family serine peptidase [Oscillospiraceae bacterium]|nr:prolyl oligopeptidase family serine peptidase [Oscillospiraceae bacterium]